MAKTRSGDPELTTTQQVQEIIGARKFMRRAILLSWFTIGYNAIEGVISIAFGFSSDSVALFGFGVDSFIEVGSAFLVLWRFRGEMGQGDLLSIARERRATWGIGLLFLGLAIGTAIASVVQLLQKAHPETSIPGLVVSTLSLSFMFYLWREKRTVALALDSATVMKDAACSLACIKLSVVLFAGSLLYLVLPSFWWADSVAAVVLSGFIAQEGWETTRAARSEDFSGGCGCSD